MRTWLATALLAAAGAVPAGSASDDCLLRTYDVRDLLTVEQPARPTAMGVFEGTGAHRGRGFRVVSGAWPTPDGGEPPAPSAAAPGVDAELLRLVREAVGEDAWAPRGPGRVVLHEGLLCVWQKPAAHARVRALLERMRRRGGTQLVVRVGLYLCDESAFAVLDRRLSARDLPPAEPLLSRDAPRVRAALLKPDEVVKAARLLGRISGVRTLFSGTVACLPVRAAALEEVRQVVFVSTLEERGDAVRLEPGLASAGTVLWLNPLPSADLERIQLEVSARVGYLAGLSADPSGESAGAIHRADLRRTALEMALVVPAGRAVLVRGPAVTLADGGHKAVSGRLLFILWPAVVPRKTGEGATAEDMAALRSALERPFGVSLRGVTLAEAMETLSRAGVTLEVEVRGSPADRKRVLAERVTLVRRRTNLIEVLGTLLGDRLEGVELCPPGRIRLRIAGARPAAGAGERPETDEPIGHLSVKSADGRGVVRFPVRQSDLVPEVRAYIEELLSETFRNRGADSPRQ